jgi:hypothetical protein
MNPMESKPMILAANISEYIDDFASNGLPPHKNMNRVVAYAIWTAFFSCFGLSWVMSRQVVDLYACWWTASST